MSAHPGHWVSGPCDRANNTTHEVTGLLRVQEGTLRSPTKHAALAQWWKLGVGFSVPTGTRLPATGQET